MDKKIQYVTVKAIVTNSEGKILLMKDEKGKWELPGGKIDFGESPQEALNREMHEELSSKVEVGSLIDAWSFNVNKPDLDKQYIVLVYSCKIPSVNFSLSSEHQDAGWLSLDEIKKLDIREGYISSISLALAT